MRGSRCRRCRTPRRTARRAPAGRRARSGGSRSRGAAPSGGDERGVGGARDADHVRAQMLRQLHRARADRARRAVHEHGRAGLAASPCRAGSRGPSCRRTAPRRPRRATRMRGSARAPIGVARQELGVTRRRSIRSCPTPGRPPRTPVTPSPRAATSPENAAPRMRWRGPRMPIASLPGSAKPFGKVPDRIRASPLVTAADATRTSTWPARGCGVGTSRTRATSGGPYLSTTTARIRISLHL